MTFKKIFNCLCVAIAVCGCLGLAAVFCVTVYHTWRACLLAVVLILVVTAFFRGINILLDGDW